MNSENPFNSPPTAPRKRRRMNLFTMAAIAACCVFFACSGCCFLTALLLRARVVDTPAGAIEAASAITDWELPTNFVGKSGAIVDNRLFRFDFARFEHNEGRGLLIAGQMRFKMFPGYVRDLQLQENLEKNTPDLRKIDFNVTETRKLVIRGGPAEFQIGRGEDRATTARYRQVIGHFQGKLDHSILILQCEEDFLTDEQIDQFIKSIK